MSVAHHLVVGDPRHGVTRLGRTLLATGAPATVIDVAGGPPAGGWPIPGDARFVHAHLNDDLLGTDPLGALEALGRGRRVAITLHDIPQPAEGEARYARRRELYRALAQAGDLVLVCSEHERASLRRCGFKGPVTVVDHPIDAGAPAEAPAPAPTVGVLGWVHPGKGHEVVLEAMAEALPGGTLRAIGAPSPGHDDDVRRLHELAAAAGLTFEITGYLPGDELIAACRAVAVPVCAHRHISASGSLGAWASAGRAPLVRDHPYAREIVRRCPGALHLVEGPLGEAVARAAAEPARTMLADPALVGPTTPQASAHQARVLAEWTAA